MTMCAAFWSHYAQSSSEVAQFSPCVGEAEVGVLIAKATVKLWKHGQRVLFLMTPFVLPYNTLFISDRKYMCHRWLTWHTVAIHIIMSSVIITFKPVLSVTMLPTATAHQSWSWELCCSLSPLWLSLSQLSSHFRLTTNPTNMSAAVATYSDKLNKVLHQKGVVSIPPDNIIHLIVFISCRLETPSRLLRPILESRGCILATES